MSIFNGGSYQPMVRTSDNFFEYNPPSELSGTLTVRVTATDGQVLEDQVCIIYY